ncbi:uncharacterized protein LOC105020488 isoform X7 [Esox lucius]|uniref:uncharacterized protein LOC105020488 isoform X6 n=1 Tax=Esox lucius TaxID=8010 RepID=UPI00097344E3|nr:uncharacterized protein LOC105020488 isoform X6 [Esox lucius]XP_028972833.1 uncharacterized protein LOC105020488 isoform X7 [Esox lucius]
MGKAIQHMMEDCLHTSSENLSKLVRWAHSHGTICALIPNLQHLLTEGSHGNLTAMWGCSAGHAYHWPLPATCKTGIKERGTCYQDSRSIHSDSLSLQGGASAHQSSPGGERFLTRTSKAKGGDSSQTRDSCDFSNCSDDNTEADDNTEEYNSNLFDIVCESSATDEDGDVDYEPHHRPRKRATQGGMPGPQRPGSEDRAQGDKPVKRIKQETAEDYYTVANAQLAAAAGTNSGLTSHSSQSPKPNNPQPRMPQPGLPPKPTQLDADSLGGGVGGVASSLLGLGRSSPHIPMLAKPLRGSVSGSVLKPSAMNSGSPRHQDSSSGSTQGLSTLTGAAGEMIEGLTSEDLLKPGGTEGPFGDLTPSSPIGMNSDLDLMAAHDLGADTKEEATDVFWPTSSTQCLGSEPTEEKRKIEEFVASIDLGQLRSLQSVLHQVLSFRIKTERGEERTGEERTGEARRGVTEERREERRGEVHGARPPRPGYHPPTQPSWQPNLPETHPLSLQQPNPHHPRTQPHPHHPETHPLSLQQPHPHHPRTQPHPHHPETHPLSLQQPHPHHQRTQPHPHHQRTQPHPHHPETQPHPQLFQLQSQQTLNPQPEAARWRGRHREQQHGQQELYPGSGVLLSSLQLAAMFQEARGNCMRLFHLLFEHFFTEEDLIGAVAFGRRGKVPDGKKVLDRRTVDAIIAYVLHCSALDGWTSVESSKLKKACINKCRLRMCQRRKMAENHYYMS